MGEGEGTVVSLRYVYLTHANIAIRTFNSYTLIFRPLFDDAFFSLATCCGGFLFGTLKKGFDRPFFLRDDQRKRRECFMSKQNKKLRMFVTVAMLISISFILMLFNFPLPWFPSFLQIDFSDVPALIAAITMGPIAAIVVEIIKNLLDWIYSGSPTGVPVGHIANFASAMLFILPVYAVYKKFPTMKGLVSGLVVGTITMSVGMAALNYVAFLPMYGYFMNFHVDDMLGMAVKAILPFNVLKGILLIAIITLLYRSMKAWIDKQHMLYSN